SGSILAFTCFTWLVSVVEPTRVATYAYVNPVVALVLGAWLAGEPVGSRILLATPIILIRVVLAQREQVGSLILRATPIILVGLALVLRSKPGAGESGSESSAGRRAVS